MCSYVYGVLDIFKFSIIKFPLEHPYYVYSLIRSKKAPCADWAGWVKVFVMQAR